MYRPPILTVDGLIFRYNDGKLELLLIKRKAKPFAGTYALPGGYGSQGQTTQQAMDTILARKAGLNLKQLEYLEQLYTFDMIGRDPRGHAVSVTYFGILKNAKPKVSSTTESPQFFDIQSLPALAFDHKTIINYAITRLQAKLSYTNIAVAFMPTHFSLPQLQSLYESILDRKLDKRNFRKQIKAQDLVKETDELLREGRHRPARLYQFTNKRIDTLHF